MAWSRFKCHENGLSSAAAILCTTVFYCCPTRAKGKLVRLGGPTTRPKKMAAVSPRSCFSSFRGGGWEGNFRRWVHSKETFARWNCVRKLDVCWKAAQFMEEALSKTSWFWLFINFCAPFSHYMWTFSYSRVECIATIWFGEDKMKIYELEFSDPVGGVLWICGISTEVGFWIENFDSYTNLLGYTRICSYRLRDFQLKFQFPPPQTIIAVGI